MNYLLEKLQKFKEFIGLLCNCNRYCSMVSRKNNPSIFLCYHRKETKHVTRSLYYYLQLLGAKSIYFDMEASDSDNFWQKIEQHVQTCDFFIFIFTPQTSLNIVETNRTYLKELELAINSKRRIIPLLVDNPSDEYIWPKDMDKAILQIKRISILFLRTDSFFEYSAQKLFDRINDKKQR